MSCQKRLPSDVTVQRTIEQESSTTNSE